MTFAFYLKDKNGKDKTPLVLVVSHGNRKYKKQIGVSVKPSEFKKQRTKNEDVNRRLVAIETYLINTLNQFSTPDDISRAMTTARVIGRGGSAEQSEEIAKKASTRPTFWEHFYDWSERDMPSKRYRQLAYRRVSEIMGMREDWEDVNSAYYFRFIQRCNDLGYSQNYKSTLSAKIQAVLIEGKKLKYHNSDEYKAFKHGYEVADAIALTQEEVDALWKAKLKGREAEARDVFIVGIYTASRFQNYSKLSEKNIVNGMIQFVQPKTGESVIIPLSPKVGTVLKRHGGSLPKITEQEIGRAIKNICRGIGGSFLETYEIKKSVGSKTVIERKEKWELITTHTARRTGATLLHLAGVPDYQLMKITGHKTLQNLQKYLRISKEENAKLLAKNPFFK